MVTTKNVGTEISPRDDVVSSELDSRPPFGIKKDLLIDPVRNELLASLLPSEGPQSLSQVGLLPADLANGALQSDNVRFIHEHPKYTNRFVFATIPFVRQPDKEVCTVLGMTTTARRRIRAPIKAPKTTTKKRQAKPGRDGKILGERLALAMAHETGRRAREYKQADLLDDVNRLAGGPADAPLLSQQMLSAIMTGLVSRSSFSPFMAAACHVNPLWLSDGVGSMT